jgi:hypothetical protein
VTVGRPASDAVDEMLMMQPDLRATMCGSACLQVMNMPLRFKAMIESQVSSATSEVLPSPLERPTLLCRMSMRP